jgi:hypothetical protein
MKECRKVAASLGKLTRPDAILASMGLDAEGIAATARGLLVDAS